MAYANATVSLLGVVGNILAVVVLLSKDMRKNCFSQLLIGKENAAFSNFLKVAILPKPYGVYHA